MPEIAAEVDQDPLPPSNFQRYVKRVIKSFFLSAGAAAFICAVDPDAAATFGKLGGFTPSTMTSLLGDALLGCDAPPPGASKVASNKKCTSPALDPDACRRAELLNHGEDQKRECTPPLIPGWPVTGQWLSWLDAHGVPRIPVFGILIAVADVAINLLVPTGVSGVAKEVVGFVGLLQLVLGFGITALLLKPVSKWLNDAWLVLILALGTLLIGASATWLVLWLMTTVYAGMAHLVGPLISMIVAIAATYAGAAAIIKYFLEGPVHHVMGDAADILADKIARWFVRYAP